MPLAEQNASEIENYMSKIGLVQINSKLGK